MERLVCERIGENLSGLKQKCASLESTTGRRGRTRRSLRRISSQIKKPENKNRFRGMNPHRPRRPASPSTIQTILSALELHQVMRGALVGFTTDREFTCTALHFVQRRCHPAPKVKYFVIVIITQLYFDDTLNRADRDALG
jgi:hypothetical protein